MHNCIQICFFSLTKCYYEQLISNQLAIMQFAKKSVQVIADYIQAVSQVMKLGSPVYYLKRSIPKQLVSIIESYRAFENSVVPSNVCSRCTSSRRNSVPGEILTKVPRNRGKLQFFGKHGLPRIFLQFSLFVRSRDGVRTCVDTAWYRKMDKRSTMREDRSTTARSRRLACRARGFPLGSSRRSYETTLTIRWSITDRACGWWNTVAFLNYSSVVNSRKLGQSSLSKNKLVNFISPQFLSFQ